MKNGLKALLGEIGGNFGGHKKLTLTNLYKWKNLDLVVKRLMHDDRFEVNYWNACLPIDHPRCQIEKRDLYNSDDLISLDISISLEWAEKTDKLLIFCRHKYSRELLTPLEKSDAYKAERASDKARRRWLVDEYGYISSFARDPFSLNDHIELLYDGDFLIRH